MARFVETDVSTRVYRLSSGINEAITLAANEPSLGLFRVQEHAVQTIPKLVEENKVLEETCQTVQGKIFDVEYDTEAIRGVADMNQFANILSDLKKAIEIKQRLNHLEMQERARELQAKKSSPALPRNRNYGAVGESPPLQRAHNRSSINSATIAAKDISGIEIAPKQF